MEENGLFNKPEEIFNVDESGLNIELRKGEVNDLSKECKTFILPRKRWQTPWYCELLRASGRNGITPFVIYEKSFPSGNYAEKGPIGAVYAKSPNGYMNEKLYLAWLNKVYIPNTRHLGKTIHIIDGHGSHISLPVDLARDSTVDPARDVQQNP